MLVLFIGHLKKWTHVTVKLWLYLPTPPFFLPLLQFFCVYPLGHFQFQRMASNHSPERMKELTQIRLLNDCQKKCDALVEKVARLERQVADLKSENLELRRRSAEALGPNFALFDDSEDSSMGETFRRQVRENIVRNLMRKTPEYSEAMRDFAFIIRSMCANCYEFVRTFIHMPTLKNLDPVYKEGIDKVDNAMSDIEYLDQLLASYRTSYITEDYNGGVRPISNDGHSFEKDEPGRNSVIPCILGVDAMAIEPYCVPKTKSPDNSIVSEGVDGAGDTELTNPMEMTNESDTPTESATTNESAITNELAITNESEKCAYFFVYYLMPIDPTLPKIVASVLPKKTGNADDQTISRLHEIKQKCQNQGFWVAAATGDGDHKYGLLIRDVAAAIRGDKKGNYTYDQFVDQLVQTHGVALPFITDFLHFAKCLRNRLASHPLSMTDAYHCFTGKEVADYLGIGNLLDPKSPGAQLKDSIAMGFFNLENLVALLRGGHTVAAIYFMPIVLWRIVNQALNIRRSTRVQLLRNAFETVRWCYRQYEHTVKSSMLTVAKVTHPVPVI
jgi:hypothetical protein